MNIEEEDMCKTSFTVLFAILRQNNRVSPTMRNIAEKKFKI